MSTEAEPRTAELYRMVMPEHVCPYGLKAMHLLRTNGFAVEDHWLRTRADTDAFQAEHHVQTTPQVFIEGRRVGGYDDLRRYFGLRVRVPTQTSYRPVIAIFSMTALMAVAISYALYHTPFGSRVLEVFVSLSMCALAIQKLQDVETFSTMFLNYDVLAKRWVPYAYFYPFGEATAGVLMLADFGWWLSTPIALFIGTVGAYSVFKAVYIERRTLKCACVGGSSSVPLGFVSLTENVMMICMALWALAR